VLISSDVASYLRRLLGPLEADDRVREVRAGKGGVLVGEERVRRLGFERVTVAGRRRPHLRAAG
jgi:hypothetical protein